MAVVIYREIIENKINKFIHSWTKQKRETCYLLLVRVFSEIRFCNMYKKNFFLAIINYVDAFTTCAFRITQIVPLIGVKELF